MTPGSPSRHASDCAVHNAPALAVGPCDCSAKANMTLASRMRAAAEHNRHYETLRELCLEGATALEIAQVAIEQLPATSITDAEIKRVALTKIGVQASLSTTERAP